MHGVGYEVFPCLFAQFGLPLDSLIPVPSQMAIDPEFPTVPFPNPEEKGALKLAIAHATEAGCKMVLANDPDADRFTAAERQPEGSWHQFSGDELGLLFADWQMAGKGPGLVVSSVVSSQMARALCKARAGCVYQDCLTGFKWIANQSISARAHNPDLVHLLGYEEAIGYQLTPIVPDKDGLSAGCVWAQMALFWHKEDKTMKQRLYEIQKNEIGFFVTSNGYFISRDSNLTGKLFADFRGSSIRSLTHLGGLEIERIRDVTYGIDTSLPEGTPPALPVTPDAEMITIFFKNNAVVTIRASGTEPKVKYYSEMSSRNSPEEAKEQLDQVVEIIKREFYKPHINKTLEPQPIM
jgi:phosphomannomutase